MLLAVACLVHQVRTCVHSQYEADQVPAIGGGRGGAQQPRSGAGRGVAIAIGGEVRPVLSVRPLSPWVPPLASPKPAPAAAAQLSLRAALAPARGATAAAVRPGVAAQVAEEVKAEDTGFGSDAPPAHFHAASGGGDVGGGGGGGPSLCLEPRGLEPRLAEDFEAVPPGTPRDSLVHSLFRLLDLTGTGTLACSEVRRFASAIGFAGGDDEWRGEFLAMCRYLGCDPVRGVDFASFMQLLNDSTSKGCFCSNADLRVLRDEGLAGGVSGCSSAALPPLSGVSLLALGRCLNNSGFCTPRTEDLPRGSLPRSVRPTSPLGPPALAADAAPPKVVSIGVRGGVDRGAGVGPLPDVSSSYSWAPAVHRKNSTPSSGRTRSPAPTSSSSAPFPGRTMPLQPPLLGER